MDAQCSKIPYFRHLDDHETNCFGSCNVGHTQIKSLRNKTMGVLQNRRKASRHVEGKKLNADIVEQYERSQGSVYAYFIIE